MTHSFDNIVWNGLAGPHASHAVARRLMTKLISREIQRGETPCLHVMRDNRNAARL